MAVNIIPAKQRPWLSKGSEEEIEREALPRDKDACVKAHFSARRDVFINRRRTAQSASTVNADEALIWLKSPKDPANSWLHRKEVDVGVQAVRSATARESQTPYYRKVTVAIQAEPEVVDARVEPGKEEPVVDGKMKSFFAKVLPRVMHHLTQNTEIPIFGDDYVNLADEDTFVGNREESYLKEAGNFFHHHTRDKHITSMDWRPGKSAIAVAVMNPVSMQERFEKNRSVDSAVCIVWNFNEQQSNPQFILEAPAEVLVIKFCPTKPHIIVGGLINGQVAVWDISVDNEPKNRQSKQAQKARAAQVGDDDIAVVPRIEPQSMGQTTDRRLKPIQQSRVEYSHRRSVQDICWLPADIECGFDTKFVEAKDGQNQFCTIGEDGVMFLWDLRPAHQPEQKMKRLKSSKIPSDLPLWVPLLKWTLSRPEGNGEILGLRFHIECKDTEGNPQYLMCCTSVEGEFATCYWGPKDERQSNQSGFDDMTKKETRVVRSLSAAHAGPAWGVQRHPHPMLQDFYLTVGDWGFKIWQLGLTSPILASPLSDKHGQVMCGRWSPTRPAVLFIGTRDGYVEVWDLLDRSHGWLFETQVIQEAITVLEFKPVNERRGAPSTQHLAVGTKQGYFQLFELPKKLVKQQHNEVKQTKHFFEREGRRVAYFGWRWKERTREMDLMLQDRGEPKGKGEDEEKSEKEDANYDMGAKDDEEFFELVDALNEGVQEEVEGS